VQKKLKILSLLLLILIITACTATRKRGPAAATGVRAALAYSAVIEKVKENNITEEGFYLRKGRIEITGTAIDGSYGLNARYNTKGDLNASVRGPLGIELVRLVAIDGQIYLVDRIGKTVYRGTRSELLRKYGLPDNVIAVIFGDLINTGKESYSVSGRERMLIRDEIQNFERETGICMNEGKVCEETYRDRISGNEVLFRYSKFRNNEDKKYASEISMEQKMNKVQIRIRIDDLICGYSEEVNYAMPSYKVRNL